MKYLPSPATFLSCLATAACLAVPTETVSAADPYRKDTHGPRIGTRILLFVKDIAYGDNPNDRYRHLPKNQQKQRPPGMPPQQPDPGIRPPGKRYSLDRPPMPNDGPPAQQPPPAVAPEDNPPQNSVAPRDLPLDSQDAPPPEKPERRPLPVEGQNPEPPPVKVKPKVPPPSPKPTASPKAQLEDAPPTRPEPKEPAPAPQTLTASTNSGSSKRSWQSASNESPTPSPPTPPPSQPAVENTNSQVSTLPMTVTSATLTGSKTGKDGRVKSPYPPFNELDVTGLPAGSLAMDPTTGKVFRVP
jgi:hypothetical protein